MVTDDAEPNNGFYLGTSEGSTGPYTLLDIQAMAEGGLLLDHHFIWNEESSSWQPWREALYGILGSSAGSLVAAGAASTIEIAAGDPALSPYHCRDHSSAFAVAHCRECHRFLCFDCLNVSSGSNYCSRCLPAGEGAGSEDIQSKVEAFFGKYYHDQRACVAAVLIAAVLLFEGIGPSSGKISEGITTSDAERMWAQSRRALVVAREIDQEGASQRAARWYRLASEAAKGICGIDGISPAIREQAFTYRMRAAVDLEDYADLAALVTEYEAIKTEKTRSGEISFFQGCEFLYGRGQASEAMGKFIEASGHSSGSDIGTLITVFSQGNMRAREKATQLLEEIYSRAELYYRMGECAERIDKKTRARLKRHSSDRWSGEWNQADYYKNQPPSYFFEIVSTMDDANPESQKWIRKSKERLSL